MRWRSIIHAEGVFGEGWQRRRYHPRRRHVGWVFIISSKQGCGLPVLRDPMRLLAQILEVVGADAEFQHFLDHRQAVRK